MNRTDLGQRASEDEVGLLIASAWSMRGTCGRKRVGCLLVDCRGYPLSSGYNGPAAGQQHCSARAPCPGFHAQSGDSLDLCEAVHAEANALMRCADVTRVHTCYVTHSPCLACVKLLLNTPCSRVVFAARYAHDELSMERWQRRGAPGTATREWVLHKLDHAVVLR